MEERPKPKRRRSTLQIEELLGIYSTRGHSIDHICGLLGRAPTTIKRYASRLKLPFADFKPR